MSDEEKEDGKKEDKEERRKRKELRRQKREEFQNRLRAVDETDAEKRNPIIIEIVKQHLGKGLDVFQARWQRETPLSNDVFLNTPLFWYKKHKWSHKDVKEFFKIVGVHKDNLDSELSVIWGIDESAKKKKKEKRKKMKEKHLRKESFASLLTLRHSSLQLMQQRSTVFVQKSDPKAENASIEIWNYMVKTYGGSEEQCAELNHDQFNIALNDNNIQVDPDLSVDLFYELIRTWEIIEKHREEKKNHPEKYTKDKKSKYKQSRTLNTQQASIKAIGGSSALNKVKPIHVIQLSADDELPDMDAVVEELNNEMNEAGGDEKKKKEDEADLPQKDKIKYIKKKKINRQYIKRMLRHINKNIKREHQIANPKKLKKSKLILVVFSKIFEFIQKQQPFDVQNDYISQALTGEQLNNPTELLEILETRDAEWKQRVQCLEYLEGNILSNENLKPLFEEENVLWLIVGWTTQLYDERSRITQTAAELFPSLLTVLLAEMETPAIIFDEENNCLDTILEALFTLLKNKRAKTLADIAHDVLIETINILSTVAEDLDDTAYQRIIDSLYQHSIWETEKHEKVRAGCMAYSLFVIYGTEAQEMQNSNNLLTAEHLKPLNGDTDYSAPASPVGSDGEGEAEQKLQSVAALKADKEKRVKIAKAPIRAFLFDDEPFMKIFAKILESGIEDRGKEPREKAMKVLKKVESTHQHVLEKYIDGVLLSKFEKWKRFNQPKGKKASKKGASKKKRVSPIKRMKTVPPKKLLTKNSGGAQSVNALSADDADDGQEEHDNNDEQVPNGK